MSISSIGGSTIAPAMQQAIKAPEAREVSEHDGDSDDSGVKAAQTTPASSVNLNGQQIGQLINVKA